MEKKVENEMETGVIQASFVWYFIWGYYGTQYRARFYPSFGVEYFI